MKLSRHISHYLVPKELRTPHLGDAIGYLGSVEQAAPSDDVLCPDPIFLLTSGWRTGSTLLQRLICSDKSVLIWGEPYGDSIPVPRLANGLANFSADSPYLRYTTQTLPEGLTEEWIANLYPDLSALRSAHLAYFEHLFAHEAHRLGFQRWGVKWVRLTAEHALYLKWLYPRARLIFLVRHPLSAYQSYKGQRWFTIKPEHPVRGAVRFMSHWDYLTRTFLEKQHILDSMLIRYEDLIQKDRIIVREIVDYLGADIQVEVLDTKIGSRAEKRPLRWWDFQVCHALAGKTCRVLGYHVCRQSSSRIGSPSKVVPFTYPFHS